MKIDVLRSQITVTVHHTTIGDTLNEVFGLHGQATQLSIRREMNGSLYVG